MGNPFKLIAGAFGADYARDCASAAAIVHRDESELWAACRALDLVRGKPGGFHAAVFNGAVLCNRTVTECRDEAQAYLGWE